MVPDSEPGREDGRLPVYHLRLMGYGASLTSVVNVRGRERAERALRLRADGLTFKAIGAELGVTPQAAHKAVKRALQDKAEEVAEAADEFRALESERLDTAAQALWPKVMAGEERAQEVWLKNRTRFAALNGLDMRPEQHEAPTTFVINTALPPGAFDILDEIEGPAELEAGEAG